MIADIPTILDELAQGRMVVLVDDEDRENEGDLLVAARFATPDIVNFMSRHARGLICVTLTEAHCQRLRLPKMAADNGSAFGTNFTVSVEAAHGITTGISAHDRAVTIRAIANPDAVPEDIVTPGHIFPVQAMKGGVLMRAGHTEAGCDLTHLAGLFPAAVICEIMKDDGSMARMPDLLEFAAAHGLKVGTIKSLIAHRLENEQLIVRAYEHEVDTLFGRFNLTAYHDTITERLHLALWHGAINAERPVLTRVGINPTALDSLLHAPEMSSWGLGTALQKISQEEAGIVLILSTGEHSDERLKRQLGMLPMAPPPADGSLRHYGLGAQILRDLGAGKIRLLSSHIRLPNMEGFGLSIEEIIEHPDKATDR